MYTAQKLAVWQSTTLAATQDPQLHLPHHLEGLFRGRLQGSQEMDSSWNQHTTSAMLSHTDQPLPLELPTSTNLQGLNPRP